MSSALQVGAQYDMLRGKKLPAAALVVGGCSEAAQVKAIRAERGSSSQLPAAFEDFIDRRMVDLSKIKVLVLDEADRMLDMGFIQAIRRIVAPLPRSVRPCASRNSRSVSRSPGERLHAEPDSTGVRLHAEPY